MAMNTHHHREARLVIARRVYGPILSVPKGHPAYDYRERWGRHAVLVNSRSTGHRPREIAARKRRAALIS